MTFGWRERILDINLTSGEISVRSLPRLLYQETIGGIGLAAQLIYDNVPAVADPLGADNVLALVAGPLSGTTWAGTGRLVVAAQSPLTGLWGEASLGGYFATQLKRAGYDAILLRGISPEPVTLVILEDEVYLETAVDLWGLETYTAENHLQAQYPKAEIITIGPAGENKVPMASLVHHQGNNVAARCGLGSVAGSKRLKALVARGKEPVPIADPEAFKALKQEAIKLFNAHDFIQVIRRGGGTAAATPIAIEMADLTAKNWNLEVSEWGTDKADKITGPAMQAQFPTKQDTCYACPVACKWTVTATQIEGETGRLAGPEYESLAGLGTQTQTNDPLIVIQTGDLCNRLGLDTISAGATIAWALEAHEKGILTDKQIDDDLELKWGDPQLVQELVRRMGKNQPGLGTLLAQGTRRAAQIIGGGLNFAIQVKGLELPFHHPRALRGLEIAYATLPRGATHNEEGVAWDWDDSTYEAWVRESIGHMNLAGANSSMVYCQFLAGALNTDYTVRLLTAVTGIPYTPADLNRVGERAWYLRRAFNLRLGIGLEADELPRRIIRQIEESQATLTDFAQALAEFQKQRELDKQGIPSARKLTEVGLEKLVVEFDTKGKKFD
ncbi:MAG: aldehyde ferredoxin oxidoreductase family protein [Chloroflexi bacterium]|nr:aldehyde ferredoxin oxidoreductase family protein [Chloroflexota bacterium]